MRLTLAAVLALSLFACRKPPQDDDEDGDPVTTDCDDTNAAVNSAATELCNDIDDNCNGIVDGDATDQQTWFADGDGDAHGNAGSTTQACTQPEGFVAEGDDCNDNDAAYHPGADEKDCTDPNDYNCDGSSGFADADNDGFPACKECDDGDPGVSPVAAEVCDGVDNDCDGTEDQGALDAVTYYADTDADGFGDPATSEKACEAPTDFVTTGTDCDDASGDVHPGATETCDGEDENCNEVIDDGATDTSTWYADVDKDGFAGSAVTVDACAAPPGYLDKADDCDDLDPSINPNTIWYADADADGYGDATTTKTQCDQPADYVDNPDDCNDADAALNPSTVWYVDGDGDGHGALSKATVACQQPPGYAALADDCDDVDPNRFTGNTEACDGIDNDCDANIDEAGSTGETMWFRDTDGDGFGATKGTSACTSPGPEFVTKVGDCNDGDKATYPGAKQVCDDLDHDCDGKIDYDTDTDGFADSWCGGSDCNDKSAAVNPNIDGGCDCAAPNDGSGNGPLCPAVNCNDILTGKFSTGDGFYWLYPEGGATTAAYEAYCDMTRDGGGWTLVGDYVSNAELFAWDPSKNQLQNNAGGSTVTAPPKLDGTVKGHVAWSNFGSDGDELRLECRTSNSASWYSEITPLFADYTEGDAGVYGAARWGIVERGVAYGRSSHWSCGSVQGGAGTWRGIGLCSGAGAGGSFANHKVSLNFNNSAGSYGGGLSIGCNGAGFDLGKTATGEAKVWYRRANPKPMIKIDFDGNYNDSSGNNRNGTPYGAATLETGYRGQAMRVYGTGSTNPSNSWVELPNIDRTQSVSVAAWIKSNTVGRYNGVWQMISNYSEFILGTDNFDSNNMCFIVATSRGWEYASCYAVPNPTAWHHFVGTYDSGSGAKRLYVDGILQNATGTSKIPPNLPIVLDAGAPNTIDLGHRECCDHGNFDGWLDEVRIYDRPLDAAEVKALYTGTEP